MVFQNVCVEITRRCNMKCEHCLRGPAQALDLSDEILEHFFLGIRGADIVELTITGGEPSLVPDRIKSLLKIMKKHGVSYNHFFLATNAKNIQATFLESLSRLSKNQHPLGNSRVCISNDLYHEFHARNYSKLLRKKLRGVHIYKRYDMDRAPIIIQTEGRGKALGIKLGALDKGARHPKIDVDKSDYVEGWVCLNCKGNIHTVPDLSYRHQDYPSLIVCNVLQPFDILALLRHESINPNYQSTLECVE